jgi:hypothetical protein
MRFRAAAVLFAWTALTLTAADGPEPRWMVLNRVAHEAREAKDYAKLRVALVELQPLLPGNPQILYELAAADAHLGHAERALAELNSLADAGLVYDFGSKPESKSGADFSSLRGTAGFASLLGRFEGNRTPVSHAEAVSDLPERDLLPEDMAYDPKTRRFLIGSVTRCKIVTAEGALFAKAEWPVMALRVDTRRRVLWAATGWLPHCGQCDPGGKDRSALLAFNLDSGALVRRVDSPVKGLLGDMTISQTGDLYVSESIYGAVLRLKANATAIERLDTPGEFPSPQTPALSADEQTLYVPDYERGIAAMDLKTRAVRWLQPAGGIVVSGIDGFYPVGDSFLAVQNGVKPERLVRFNSSLTKQEILEANTPGLGEPTHGTLVGGVFYFIANTGWDAYDDDGHKKPDSGPVESQIRKIVLDGKSAGRP